MNIHSNKHLLHQQVAVINLFEDEGSVTNPINSSETAAKFTTMSSDRQRSDDESPSTSSGSSDADQRDPPAPEPEEQEERKPSATQQKKNTKLSSKTTAKLSTSAKRIQKELAEITLDPPPNCSLPLRAERAFSVRAYQDSGKQHQHFPPFTSGENVAPISVRRIIPQEGSSRIQRRFPTREESNWSANEKRSQE
ncbi:unnamed protein product, partial [Caretta caretta]